jgi:hypothetical protein
MPIVDYISVHISFSGQSVYSSDIFCILDFDMYLVYRDTSEDKPSFPWGFLILLIYWFLFTKGLIDRQSQTIDP